MPLRRSTSSWSWRPGSDDPTRKGARLTSHDAGLVGAVWQKSSHSGGNGGQCVEVARNLPGVVAVRDSKDPGGPSLVVTAREWRAFTDGLRRGGFGPR